MCNKAREVESSNYIAEQQERLRDKFDNYERDAALNHAANQYNDALFAGAEQQLAMDEQRVRDFLDDEAFFVDVLHEWVDYDTLNTLIRAIFNSVDMGISPELFCKSLHEEIIQNAILKMRKEA